MSELIVISDSEHEALIEKVSKQYREMLIDLDAVNSQIISAWPGGRSLLKFFPAFSEVLANLPNELLSKKHFFQVDERVSQDFNREQLEQNFFSNLVKKNIINRNQLHYYPTDLDPKLGLQNYSNLLDRYGAKFNYVMLGAGNPHQRDGKGQVLKYDCHVAGIFAHHPSSKEEIDNFCYYFESPKPPNGRITATYNLLSKSDWCFLFIMGEEKKEVLSEFMNNKVSISDAPVKIARKIKNCVLITDQKI